MLHITCLARNDEGQEEYFHWPDDRIDAVELGDGAIRIDGDAQGVRISWPESMNVDVEHENGRHELRLSF